MPNVNVIETQKSRRFLHQNAAISFVNLHAAFFLLTVGCNTQHLEARLTCDLLCFLSCFLAQLNTDTCDAARQDSFRRIAERRK